MNDISLLTDEEYSKICYAIPYQHVVDYFKRYPKEFSKVKPGFRATSLTNENMPKLLVKFRNNRFISSFVEQVVNKWINEILTYIQENKNDEQSEVISYINALYQSFFSCNVSAFFKLIDKTYSEELLNMISEFVLLLKDIDICRQDAENAYCDIKKQLKDSTQELQKSEKKLEKANIQLKDNAKKLEELTQLKGNIDELKSELENMKANEEAKDLRVKELLQQIATLKNSIDDLKKQKSEMELAIRAKIEEEKNLLITNSNLPLAPSDISEFEEYFSYNIDNIGVNNTSLPINKALSRYVSNIIFRGKPIVCSKYAVGMLAKCITNALTDNSPVNTIDFVPNMKAEQIKKAISNSGRIVVLDNFLGNINETILLSILEKFKSKIIFISVTYDKTLKYIPKEFLIYCNYINLSHIPSFMSDVLLTEDPSKIDEIEVDLKNTVTRNMHRDKASKIASELGIPRIVFEANSKFIVDDLSLVGALIFNFIPYAQSLFDENPLNLSESLQRYINRKDSDYKKIFEEWFM